MDMYMYKAIRFCFVILLSNTPYMYPTHTCDLHLQGIRCCVYGPAVWCKKYFWEGKYVGITNI